MNEIVETDQDIKMLATMDVHSCAVICVITNDKAKMAHIETVDDKKFAEGLKKVQQLLNETEKIKDIKLFIGPYASPERVPDLCRSFNISHSYTTFIDNFGNGSIAYNITTQKYYGLDMDQNFYEYEIGKQNKQKDLLSEYFSSIEESNTK